MMTSMVNRLIGKYGEAGKLNDNAIRFLRDRSDQSLTGDLVGYMKSNGYTGIQICTVFTYEAVAPTDRFLIGSRNYRVLSTNILRSNDLDVYSSSVIFEDDFTNDIEIHRQALKTVGVNLPDVSATVVASLKARVHTAPYPGIDNYSGHNGMKETHVFTALHSGVAMQPGDLIEWNARSFEILGFEDVNEQGRLLVMSTIEVLSV